MNMNLISYYRRHKWIALAVAGVAMLFLMASALGMSAPLASAQVDDRDGVFDGITDVFSTESSNETTVATRTATATPGLPDTGVGSTVTGMNLVIFGIVALAIIGIGIYLYRRETGYKYVDDHSSSRKK